MNDQPQRAQDGRESWEAIRARLPGYVSNWAREIAEEILDDVDDDHPDHRFYNVARWVDALATPSRADVRAAHTELVGRLRATAADIIDFNGKTMREWDQIRLKCMTHKGSDLPRLMFEALIENFAELMNEAAAALSADTRPDRREGLRRLVDIVWQHATESTAVPSTKTADMLIDRAAVSSQDGMIKVSEALRTDPDAAP